MTDVTPEQKTALDHARYLAEHGVPIFISRPALDDNGDWIPDGGDGGTGYLIGKEKAGSRGDWQHTKADPAVVDRWKPGDALSAVMGVVVDGVDVDPHNGGDVSMAGMVSDGMMPISYGKQDTPSVGTHNIIATLGVRSKDGLMDGLDFKAGDADGEGRGMIFIAPTVKLSKVTKKVGTYTWVEPPDLEKLAMLEIVGDGDASGAQLAALVVASRAPDVLAHSGPDYTGPAYADLSEGFRQRADDYVDGITKGWQVRLAKAEHMPEGDRDHKSRGWEALARDFVWALAMVAAAPWTALDDDEAEDLYKQIMPDALAADPRCQDKWGAGLLAKVRDEPVSPPPWGDAVDTGAPIVNVTNSSVTLKWVKEEIGRNRLSGVFRRGGVLVHTPRIGEHGYVPPTSTRDDNGPAQVRRLDPLELAARVDHNYDVFRVTLTANNVRKEVGTVFPEAVARRAASAPDLLDHVSDLVGVTHTPIVRADGTILDVPGYDQQTGMLYLPSLDLVVPPVPKKPTLADRKRARRLVITMVEDFPFITPHDLANYLGALITPVLRPLTPPPYKQVLIGAPQPGSGKSLLAWMMRELHGGVFKSDFPTTEDELRKFITSTLHATTGPVVQMDNVRGVLKSAVYEGLLTSQDYSDRPLGETAMLGLRNDRLWVVTGNNLSIGGDLERRTLWSTIDAGQEHPEERSSFRTPHLEAWVTGNRGELLWAILTLIRAWVVDGQPTDKQPTSDGYGYWVAVLRGILGNSELGETVGTVGHSESVQGRSDPESEDWARFLASVSRAFGPAEWTVADVLASTDELDSDNPEHVRVEDLPGELAEKLARSRIGTAKSLGAVLKSHNGRWEGGLAVVRSGRKSTDKRSVGSALWFIKPSSLSPIGSREY
jgi:hypothetical protein